VANFEITNNYNQQIIAHNIRNIISERGLTQTQAGERIGITQQQMASYISKIQPRTISAVNLMLFAKAMSKPVGYFYKDNS